jgi:hypothetical protein
MARLGIKVSYRTRRLVVRYGKANRAPYIRSWSWRKRVQGALSRRDEEVL